MKALKKSVDELINSFNPHQKQKKFSLVKNTWESVKESTKFINSPAGIPLSYRDRGVLELLIQLTQANKKLVDYSWLQEKFSRGGHDMSQRNIYRILQNFGNCFTCKFYNSIEFEGKKYFNKILITPTDQLQNILDDAYNKLLESKGRKNYNYCPQSSYKSEQNFLPNQKILSTLIYKYIRKQKEITTTELVTTNAHAREESEQKNEIININQKTLEVALLDEPPKVFCKEPSEPKPKIVKFMSRLEENPISNATGSGSLHLPVANPDQYATSNIITLPVPDDPSLVKLRTEICKSFGSLTGPHLVKQTSIVIFDQKKIGIRMNNIELAEEEKNQLRSCIKSVYGEDIKIVALGSKSINYPPDKTELPLPKEPIVNDKQQRDLPLLPEDIWGLIRKKLIDRLHQGKWIDYHWFSKLVATVDESSKQLTLKAPTSFTKDYIYQNYLSDIEEIATKNDFVVGLAYGNEKIYYNKPIGILKDITPTNLL